MTTSRDGTKRFWAFLKEARAELKKVTWPSRAEVMNTTIVVIIATVFFRAFTCFSWTPFSPGRSPS